ncbi:aconitate hydratase AcnA [Collinsella sp. An2]|uniref:aconitate hydratase AcnA n=1 Tax=Collinsella sp. An2 TaxID=1965585 RepID=UPI000B364DB2|nr:aconitate hydratase AcnA [Collinsella sp. An2]OUP08271.1 aconitate hydratase 1 [Collinsella sp. An2]
MTEAIETASTRMLDVDGTTYRIYPLDQVPEARRLPVSLRILLENVLRRRGQDAAGSELVHRVVEAGLAGTAGEEIEFMPSRVLFQDFTGVPVFVDFAAMRDAAADEGADPSCVNPQIPCVLVVDHSVTADVSSCPAAATENARIEAERNAERFAFLKWASSSFQNVRIVPPGVGICHQLNIERFCDVVMTADGADGVRDLYFDSLVGTDSHTPTANGMGVLGWGVGGIEAEAAALGQPITMTVPPVVGMRLTGELQPGVTAMDVALSFAQTLRGVGVVGSLVECFGPGVASLSVTQRATISNMSPEYGCTATLFPPDRRVLDQMGLFGREPGVRKLAEAYLEAQGILDVDADDIVYSQVIDFDLSAVQPSLAGPSRPHDRVAIAGLKERFRSGLAAHGREPGAAFTVEVDGGSHEVSHGAVAIAAITSCTTATDPAMMLAAGLVARRAVQLGCRPKPWVKRIFAPGSHATTLILEHAGLLEPLADLGFDVCGWGCMSCIGNSGPVLPGMHEVAGDCELTSVLSGNRNFEGRISPDVAQNFLCAPALVVCYALAGSMDVDLTSEPVCDGADGPVYLSDLLPQAGEVDELLASVVTSEVYAEGGRGLFEGSDAWKALEAPEGERFAWDEASTYVRRAPYFDHVQGVSAEGISGARALAVLGDFITTDHISPAGAIPADSPAAAYLREHGVADADFNSFGSRRGNHEVMMRGTFANVRLQNRLAPGTSGGWTLDPTSGQVTSIFEAACNARVAGLPLIVLAGKMYGSGSSRDWAAKGPALLGVRAVIAESFERIHRSNLIGMGVLPLEFMPGESVESLGLTGTESFDIEPVDFSAGMPSPSYARVCARAADGRVIEFTVKVRVDTPTEGLYLLHGGILPHVLGTLIESTD